MKKKKKKTEIILLTKKERKLIFQALAFDYITGESGIESLKLALKIQP